MNTRDITGEQLEDSLSRSQGKLGEFLVICDQQYLEIMELWAMHNNEDGEVAKQLYGDAEDALERTAELKAAAEAAHAAYAGYDWDALRRVANVSSSRLG